MGKKKNPGNQFKIGSCIPCIIIILVVKKKEFSKILRVERKREGEEERRIGIRTDPFFR